ncbi:DUF2169 domain-containing protein [Desulfonatronum sp. SC1]|uniref:DUF2169 family type VI secretion system accessory protein n=1 Tax=Desulfonatronum sp. SC1 TaxID=2109626 RepID=UPI001304FD2C|nr:DUF2169 domain-containing protein [Desulfonatronum sp. SC1]
MKIIKPDHLSLLPTTCAVAGEQRLVLSLFACFPLSGSQSDSQSASRAGQEAPGLVAEAEMWTALASVLGDGDVFDAGRPKPRAEFLVYGECVPPGAVEACPVRVRVGRVAKELMIFGDRSRDAGALNAPGRPQPFQRMPLTWENAYGGPDYPANPLGKGRGADQSGRRPVPNVILASEHPLPPNRDPSPACPRAVPSWWPQRTQYLGPFNRQWLADGARDLPATTNPLTHMSASPDQWLEGFLNGDEDFELTNLHPSRPQITGTLPGLRARAFVTGPGQDLDSFREVQTRADTVWFFPGLDLGVICYRAVVPVQDEDADDVGHVLLGHEPLTAAPLPAAHYLEQLRLELFPPDEEPAAPQEGQRDGSGDGAEEGPVEDQALSTEEPDHLLSGQDSPTPDPGLLEFQAEMERIQAESREMLAKMGYTEEQARELVHKYEVQAQEMAERLPDKSLEEMAAEAQAQAQAFLAEHGQTPEQALEALHGRQPQPLTLEDIDAMLVQGEITPEIAGHIRQAHEALAAFLALSATMAAEKTPEPDAEDASFSDGEGLAAGDEQPSEAQDLTDQDLTGQDFTDQDFSGQNLAGRDFRGAVLERTVFADADLTGAVFAGAVLTEAVFTRARCSRAVFTKADAWKADFQDADLSGADLSEADFSGGNFAGADVTDAVGTRTGFDTARMPGLKAARGRFQGAEFNRADLTGAVLEQADLTDADFDQAVLRGANLANAVAVNARFGEADLTGAVLTGAVLRESRADAATSFRDCDLRGVLADEAQWSGADLTGANMERASLNTADLSRANLRRAELTRALARNAVFSKAVLDQADLRMVNLMAASFAQASLREARLDGSSCFGADLRKAVLSGASLDKVNLKRTILDLEMLDAIE